MSMPEQLPQVAVLRIRHPNARKPVLQHEPQQQLRVLPVRFLLAYSFGADLGGVSNPRFKLQVTQQSFEPA